MDSWFAGTLGGLNWQSPMFMAHVRDYLKIVKLLLVLIGFMLLYKKMEQIKQVISSKVVRDIFKSIGYSLAILQVALLSLGILFEAIFSSDFNYTHKEKTFNNHSIYVYTADPGAMGTANHYFYLKCQLPLNRYKLIEIAKLDWMYKFNFTVEENTLVVTDNKQVKNVHRLDFSKFNCKT